jgi:hypothetical protein
MLLDLDPDRFRACFRHWPFLLPHRLVGHPLFALPRLIELARGLPESFVEYYAGDLPKSLEWHTTPRNGLSVEETIRRIEQHCSWMVLKRVEQDPDYDRLLQAGLDEIAALSEPLDPGMHERAGAIFISSPGAVTPYHMDVEYNFLVQLRGFKQFHVFPGHDRALVSEVEVEEHLARGGPNRNLDFDERKADLGLPFRLEAGLALYVPSLHPHWVKNGPHVSISFSLGFETHRSDRKTAIHVVNHRLRRFGLRPAPPGDSELRDRLKHLAYRTMGWAERRFT